MKTIQIDSAKLIKILEYKGMSYTQVSESMGHAHGYIGNCLRKGYLTVPAVKQLETIHGIKLEDYKKEEKPQETVTKKPNEETDYNKELYKLIYSAVYHAVKKALQE